MKHNDISALFRAALVKKGLAPRDWDHEIYAFADKYNGLDRDVVRYINERIDALQTTQPNNLLGATMIKTSIIDTGSEIYRLQLNPSGESIALEIWVGGSGWEFYETLSLQSAVEFVGNGDIYRRAE